jgi:hypothetical protein
VRGPDRPPMSAALDRSHFTITSRVSNASDAGAAIAGVMLPQIAASQIENAVGEQPRSISILPPVRQAPAGFECCMPA